MYMTSLNVYYLLTIRYCFSHKQFLKIKLFLHADSLDLVIYGRTTSLCNVCKNYPTDDFLVYMTALLQLDSLHSLAAVSFLWCFSMVSISCTCEDTGTKSKETDILFPNTGKYSNDAFESTRKDTSSNFVFISLWAYIHIPIHKRDIKIDNESESKRKKRVINIVVHILFSTIILNEILYICYGIQHVWKEKKNTPEKSFFEDVKEVIFNPEPIINSRRHAVTGVQANYSE